MNNSMKEAEDYINQIPLFGPHTEGRNKSGNENLEAVMALLAIHILHIRRFMWLVQTEKALRCSSCVRYSQRRDTGCVPLRPHI